MKHQLATLLLFSLLAASPASGQTTKIVSNFDAFFLFNNQIQINDSSTFAYNNDLQLNERVSWKIDGSGAWYLNSKLTDYAYDPDGNLLAYVSQVRKGNNWVNSFRNTYTYNGNGKELSYLTEQWDTTQQVWVNLQRNSTTYNVEDKQLSYIEEKWNGTSWITKSATNFEYDANGLLTFKYSSSSKEYYTYNAQNLLEERIIQYLVLGNWINDSRMQYTYHPNGVIASTTSSFWASQSWIYHYRNTDAYDANGKLITTLEEAWKGTVFENSFLDSFTYNTAGFLQQILTQTWDTTAWVNLSVEDRTYDVNHHLIYWDSHDWIAGAWEKDFRQFNEFDTNGNWLMGRVEKWKDSAWALFAFTRKKYTAFVATHSPDSSFFNIFPNPAGDAVTIKGEGLRKALIFDQQGRLIYSQRLYGQEQEILQVGNLPTGNYFLQVSGDGGKMGAKPLLIRR